MLCLLLQLLMQLVIFVGRSKLDVVQLSHAAGQG